MIISFNNYIKLYENVISDDIDIRAYNKIRLCITQIITNYGFFAQLLFNLDIVQVDDKYANEIPTMATDAKRILYNKDFVKKLKESEVIFVLIHEVLHCANFHFTRIGDRDKDLWNEAADYAINIQISDMIKDLKTNYITVPDKILLDENYRNMGSEQIYELIKKNNNKAKNQNGDPIGGDIRKTGSLEGKGKVIYSGNKEIQDAENNTELEKVWDNAIKNAAAKNQGTGSQTMDRWIRKINKPKVNWKIELRNFVNNVYSELEYQYFNKRFILSGDYLPGLNKVDTSTFKNVIITIDTSGSIGEKQLDEFASEFVSIFKTYDIEKCYIIWCDDEISSIQLFKDVDKKFKIDKLKPKGGGGTSFIPPFKWVQDNILKKGSIPAFFIYFTDAYGTAPEISQFNIRSYNKRVLWIISNNDDASNIKFGKKIYLE